VDKISVGKPEE